MATSEKRAAETTPTMETVGEIWEAAGRRERRRRPSGGELHGFSSWLEPRGLGAAQLGVEGRGPWRGVRRRREPAGGGSGWQVRETGRRLERQRHGIGGGEEGDLGEE